LNGIYVSRGGSATFFFCSVEGRQRIVECFTPGGPQFFRSTWIVRAHEFNSDATLLTRSCPVRDWPWAILSASQDGGLFLVERSRVLKLDPATSQTSVWLRAPESREIGWSAFADRQARLLITAAERPSSFFMPMGRAPSRFFAFDLAHQRAIAKFEHPAPTPFLSTHRILAISADQRFFATRHKDEDRKTGVVTLNEVAIFDLRPVLPRLSDP
jgi:hypothetical protein